MGMFCGLQLEMVLPEGIGLAGWVGVRGCRVLQQTMDELVWRRLERGRQVGGGGGEGEREM